MRQRLRCDPELASVFRMPRPASWAWPPGSLRVLAESLRRVTCTRMSRSTMLVESGMRVIEHPPQFHLVGSQTLPGKMPQLPSAGRTAWRCGHTPPLGADRT